MEASGERENNKNSKVEPRRPGREMTNESSWARILACPDSQVAWFCFAVTGQPVAGGHRLSGYQPWLVPGDRKPPIRVSDWPDSVME